ncbi:hypothetical protein [Sphingomonas sp. PvP055]|uniref:hypothetical protein n=1 Tax=Sphingomonas sp. PvP055 TaxID=3156391 RepID=UPI003391CE81
MSLDARSVCVRIEERLAEYVGHRPVDPAVLRTVIRAAYSIRHFGLIAAIGEGLDDVYWGLPIDRETVSLIHHVGIVWRSSGGGVTLYAGAPDGWWTAALEAKSEARLLRALDGAVRPGRDLDDVEIVRLVSIVALAGALGWSAGFRHGQRLLVAGVPESGVAALDHGWVMFGLPGKGLTSLGAQVRRGIEGAAAERDWGHALAAFGDAADMASASAVWDLAGAQGRLSVLLGGAPLDGVDRAALAGRVTAAAVPAAADPVWIYMTWREGADRLIGLAACYLETNTRFVVSIGAEGRPADLALASALLLADRAHMIARPVVTWGGPKLLFQNLLPVMAAFHARTGGKAWLSVVCDCSFPLHGLGRFVDRLSDSRVMARAGIRLAPQYWHGEWDAATVEDLPALFGDAMAELFETGGAQKLVGLVGSHYPQLPKDFRLNASFINFGHTSRSITGIKSLDAQTYSVSPYDADFRWMSLTRLSQFVDTATEGGPTYARSHHPWMVRWIHSVLKTQDLHAGDPFFTASHAYAERLLTDPERFALFAATGGGMGPEMTFFDTYAYTHGLQADFLHLFAPYRLSVAEGEAIDPIIEDADASDYQFVRKVPMDPNDELLNFLSRRVIDDSGWAAFHWVAAGPRDAAATADPLPVLDDELMAVLVGTPFTVRDLLDRHRRVAILEADGRVRGLEGSLGEWHYQAGWLTIRFHDPRLGEKRYCGMGANRDRLTLVPDEIVDVQNGWSAFLDFPLARIPQASGPVATLDAAAALADGARPWVGSPMADSAMIAAFIDFERSTPTPTFRHPGRAIGIRGTGGHMLVLAAIADRPALLRLHGAAAADGRTAALLSVGDAADRAAWDALPAARPVFALHTDDLPGRWRLETVEADRTVNLHGDGRITDEAGDLLGHWRRASGGLRLFGIEGLRIALTTQARVRDGRWRLTGWGNPTMREQQSFALAQL